MAENDRPQEIVAILFDLPSRIAFGVILTELVLKVIDQFVNLLLLPAVLPLKVVDRILHAFEQFANGFCRASNIAHHELSVSTSISSSSPSVSFSSASISARISSSERSGCGL